jgi:hypothetical protein
MKLRHLLLSLILATSFAHAVLPPKAIQYEGKVVTATATAITVQGKIGTRVYQIYPGTIFGRGNKSKLANFTPGTPVIVVFSDVGGVVKAENIRNPDLDRKPAPKPAAKPAAKPPAPPKKK